MKKLLLKFLCIAFVSLSFGQTKSLGPNKSKLKEQSVKAVEFLSSNLKLDKKQKTIFMNNFAKYADNMTKAIQKASKTNDGAVPSPSARESSKDIYQYMMRFAKKRDTEIKKCLKKRQLKEYDDLVKRVHPFTLEVKEKKKK